MPASTSPPSPHKERHKKVAPLPALFATETHLLGWQGLTVTLPSDWNLKTFGGDATKGDLRVDDADGPRLELRWEKPQKGIDLARSVTLFTEQLVRQAKKRGEAFQLADNPRLLSKARKRKAQLENFGWVGERGDVLLGQGWGVAWQCADCGRVVVAHLIGRGLEKQDKMQRLATEVFSSLECHSSGGWQTWSVFDLQLDIPEEFHLKRAKLLLNRLELEWVKARPATPLGWTQTDQRIALQRIPIANVVLENESLVDWTQRTIARTDKKRRFGPAEEISVRTHPALMLHGRLRDLRRLMVQKGLDRVLRRHTPPAAMRVWHCEQSNKIFALDCELSPINAHVVEDVLDSLECHR
ncbi:MAG: hypothetical protein JO316_13300 [Abitibacteriaceae bacterium]|nr:hypothetical protein [Abditibacteriaceae bacterium]